MGLSVLSIARWLPEDVVVSDDPRVLSRLSTNFVMMNFLVPGGCVQSVLVTVYLLTLVKPVTNGVCIVLYI